MLAIAGGLLLSWKSSGKAGASEGKGAKPAAERSGGNQPISVNNTGPGTVVVNTYGLTKEQYEEGQNKLLDELAAKLQNADAGQRSLLERQLQAVQEQLADTEKSYAEELTKRKAADEALAQMKGQLPDEQLKQAKLKLAQGETAAAEKAFDAVVDKEGGVVALAAYQSGQLAEGRLDYDKALRQYKKAGALEENKPKYLNAAGSMAWTMGEYRQAEELFARLLKIMEQKKDDANLGTALNNLAQIYRAQGRYSDAEPLYKRDLEISEKSLGNDHPDVAATLNNLAVLYRAQGHYSDAEPLYKRSLDIREQKLGKDHPDMAATLNNLAMLYESQGKYKEAEPLYQRCLAIFRAKFLNGHPNIDVVQQNYDELKRKMAEQK